MSVGLSTISGYGASEVVPHPYPGGILDLELDPCIGCERQSAGQWIVPIDMAAKLWSWVNAASG